MREGLEKQWDRCKGLLGRAIGAEDATAWLDSLRLERLAPDRVVLSGIPNTFFKHRIYHHFRGKILSALSETFPEVTLLPDPELELRIVPEPGTRGNPQPATAGPRPTEGAPDPQPATALPTGAGVNARYTLSSFLSAPCNESALRFAREVAERPGSRYNPLVLVAATGLGKTHLVQGLARALQAPRPQWRVVYCTGEAFKNAVLDGITRRRMGPVREHFRTADALLMDDMEFLLISPRAQEELLHTFDLLLAAGRQLVFSMGRYPRAMTGLGDALRSRLEMGLLTELTYPDTATRLCLLEAKSRADGIALPPEVARLLADRITRNLRQLEGALVRLGAYAALEGCPITREFAQRVAAPFFDPQPGGKRSVASDAVVEAVAEQFGLTVRVLKGRSRSPSVVGARRVAIHLLKQLAGLSYSEIGACLGTRSHSTVLHGHHRMLDDLKGDGPLKRTVLHLEHRLLDASGGDPVGAGIAPE